MSKRYVRRLLPFLLVVASAAGCSDAMRQQPVARAAANPSSVRAGEAVTLSSTVSNTSGHSVSFVWEQTGGVPSVELSGADAATATFTAPATPGTLTFRITVRDSKGSEAGAEVTVRVEGTVSVSAGDFHTCGVREHGEAACWGLNDEGQSAPSVGKFVAVSAGGLHACGVGGSVAVTCWPEAAVGPTCEYLAAAPTRGPVPGLIVAAEVLLPEGYRPDHGVHILFNGSIGAVADFETVRAGNPDAAVLDCRGKAVLSPGFVNAHEHPAYSCAFPDANLNPVYSHRDEWRLGIDGKLQLPPPPPYWFDPDDPETVAILIAMELRHLLGGATTIAGSGGIPGVIRNINRHRRASDLALYDAEAEVTTFPFSFQVVEDLRDECAGGPDYMFPVEESSLAFMAYVPHVGEGRYSNCAARAEGGPDSGQVHRRRSL